MVIFEPSKTFTAEELIDLAGRKRRRRIVGVGGIVAAAALTAMALAPHIPTATQPERAVLTGLHAK